jgi:hypothetical protein
MFFLASKVSYKSYYLIGKNQKNLFKSIDFQAHFVYIGVNEKMMVLIIIKCSKTSRNIKSHQK